MEKRCKDCICYKLNNVNYKSKAMTLPRVIHNDFKNRNLCMQKMKMEHVERWGLG